MSLLAFWREATTVVAGRMQSLPLAPPTAGLSAVQPLAVQFDIDCACKRGEGRQ
jgi:hypothetical protein